MTKGVASLVTSGRIYDPINVRQEGSVRHVANEAAFRRVITILRGVDTRGITILFTRPFTVSRPLVVPDYCDGLVIRSAGQFPISPLSALDSLFEISASRVTVRDVYAASVSTSRMFTSFVTIPATANVTGVRVVENEVTCDRVFVEESGATSTAPVIRDNLHTGVSGSFSAPIVVRGLAGRVIGNVLSDGGGDGITVLGGDVSIQSNDLGGSDITTTSGSGGNRLAGNTDTGTKTLHADDVDADALLEEMAAIADLSHFGDGSDGDLTASSGTTTLTRDTFYEDVTLSGTAKINTAGYQLFISGELNLENAPSGAICNDGGTGGNASGTTGGTAGAAAPGVTVGASSAGGAGGNAGAAGNTTSNASDRLGGSGGNSGTGANGNVAGGTATVVVNQPRFNRDALMNAAQTALAGAGIGGAGSGGGTGGAGGGGGGGGGAVVIRARSIRRGASTAAGVISAKGGTGGNATATTSGQGCGGGGGGGGGSVWIFAREILGSAKAGALSCTGGTGGVGSDCAQDIAGGGTSGTGGEGGDGGRVFLITPDGVTVVTGSAGVVSGKGYPHVIPRGTWSTTTDGSSAASSSFTPTASGFLFALVAAAGTTASATMTDSQGGTWTPITSVTWGGGANTMYLFARTTAPAASATTVTLDTTGDGYTAVVGRVFEMKNMTVFGSSAIRQTVTLSESGASPNPSFASAPLAANAVIAAIANGTNPAGATWGLTREVDDTGQATPTMGFTSATDEGRTALNVNCTIGGNPLGLIGLEVDCSAAYAGQGGTGGACEATL